MYPCPICEDDISNIISFQNLIDQKDKDLILFCPHCNVGLELEYDEYEDGDGGDNHFWTVKVKVLP